MPPFKKVRLLRSIARDVAAKKLHKTLVYLDSIWNPSPVFSPGSSPSSSPSSSPIGRSSSIISPLSLNYGRETCTIGSVRDWLFQIPKQLVEEVIEALLANVETIVHEDKDCKLILTLINIEKTRPSDFFFGIHSMFRILATTSIAKLPFSTKTWFSLWEFEQLTACNHLLRVMIDSFPMMADLTYVNLAYVASDKLLYVISKYCRFLEELIIDHCSQITERGIKMLAGRLGVGTSEASPFELMTHNGCRHLRYLSLQGCSTINDQSIWYLILHCKRLQVLRYHQSYSVAEILCNELRKLDDRQLPRLSLETFDHPFPYGLNIPEEEVIRVTKACPNIRLLNLVSLDSCLPSLANFTLITKATVEVEDGFGMGLYRFLESAGGRLKEFTISCGSDPDSTVINGGGRSFELFNVGMKLARRFCPQLTMLSISGCGLVTNDLLDHLQQVRESINTQQIFTNLKTLILLSYHDPEEILIQTCEEDLLFQTLRGR